MIVDEILRGIMDAVARGEKVELRGVGTFRKRASPARWGRDFGRGERVRVPAGERIGYRVSRRLRARLAAPRRRPASAGEEDSPS